MRLKVNQVKSKINRPKERNLPGFSFYKDRNGYQIRISDKSYLRFKANVKTLTSRSWSISVEGRLQKLKTYMRDWIYYFRISKCKRRLHDLDGWIKFRLRMCIWKQWKNIRTRITKLVKLGIDELHAFIYGTRKKYCRIVHSHIL